METAFNEYEKRFLLAEVIKTSAVSLETLVTIIKDSQLQPNWDEALIPQGRNIRTCKTAFYELVHSATSFDASRGRQAIESGSLSRKRPFSPETRTLQPKPASNGASQVELGVPPRKRGRPSNAEIASRNAAAISRGEQPIAPKAPGRRSLGAAPLSNILEPIVKPSETDPDLKKSPSTDGSAKKRGRPSKDFKNEIVDDSNLESSISVETGNDAELRQQHMQKEVQDAQASISALKKEDQLQDELQQEEALYKTPQETS